MAIEIERKFLVQNSSWMADVVACSQIAQGYLVSVPGKTVRIRLRDEQTFLTIKLGVAPLSRNEFEFQIPTSIGVDLLEQACEGDVIRKVRHAVPAEHGLQWEIDVFSNPLESLIMAEIELPRADYELRLPPWVGAEVTDDPAFLNENLCLLDRAALRKLLQERRK